MTILKKVEVSDFARCFEAGTEGKYLLRFNPLLILVYFTKATIIFYVNGIRFGNSHASVLWGSVLSQFFIIIFKLSYLKRIIEARCRTNAIIRITVLQKFNCMFHLASNDYDIKNQIGKQFSSIYFILVCCAQRFVPSMVKYQFCNK